MKKKIIIFLIILIFILFVAFVYIKFVGTKKLEVREYKITNSKLNNDYYGFKIVHFGDIHYGKNTNKNDLEKVINRINLLKPDIVIFTGDLIDKNTKYSNELRDELVEILDKINVKLGKYAIKGDEDELIDDYPSIMKKANFIFIENSFEYIYNSDTPILVSDLSSDKLEDTKSIYNILLTHKPDNILNLDYSKYSLILAGHSHNGQIKLPLIGSLFKFDGAKTYYDEYYELENSKLYITSGIGTSKINLRINNRPSINFYRLVNK